MLLCWQVSNNAFCAADAVTAAAAADDDDGDDDDDVIYYIHYHKRLRPIYLISGILAHSTVVHVWRYKCKLHVFKTLVVKLS